MSRLKICVRINIDKTHSMKTINIIKRENWSTPYLPYIKFVNLFRQFIKFTPNLKIK